MSSDPKNEILKELETRIQSGELGVVRTALRSLLRKKLSRPFALKVAELARRANDPLLALKVLNPIVRGNSGRGSSPQERVEYAANLLRIGGQDEAQVLLREKEVRKLPAALLFGAFAHFSTWNYRAAIPLLSEYVETESLGDYERAVGKLNLAAALVNQWDPRVSDYIESLKEEFSRKKFTRLYGNVLELCGQFWVLSRNFQRARTELESASQYLQAAQGLDDFFVRKWQGILGLMQSQKNVATLRKVREEAIRLGHWETVRDCDLFEGVLTENESLLIHTYYGTPFSGFRERIFWVLGRPFEVPRTYVWKMGEGGKRFVHRRGTWEGKGELLIPGQASHRLFTALCSDFYRPFRIAALHAALYPDDHFNPLSSPGRVHQVLKRLKGSLKSTPLGVLEHHSQYRLNAVPGCEIELERDHAVEGADEIKLESFRAQWRSHAFKSGDLARVLRLSDRTAQRLLKKALERGVIEREGSGNATLYRFSA